jgi:phosphatidate cytidylyltransferase
MTKMRVRKPFARDDAELHPGLTTEEHSFPAVELPGQEKRSTKMKNAAAAKVPEKMKHPSNLVVRTATGAVYILLTVVCIAASEATTAVYLSVLSAICAGEFYYMLRSDAKLPNEFLGICAAALFPLATWLFGLPGVVSVFAIFVLTLLVWYVFWQPARISDVAVSLFGAVYTGVIMSCAMILRSSLPEFWGAVLVLGLFASVWGNDAFAYLVGSAIGKHKLAPHISPKKSWEGFIAGLIFAMVCWCLLTYIPGVSMSIPQALVFGLVNGLSGVLGDLVESRIKRNSGFKDSGTIMPGHGGLLDRCDSQFLVTLTGTILLVLGGCIPFTL